MTKIIFREPRKHDFQQIYNFAKNIQAEDTFILLNPSEPINLKEEKEYLAGVFKKIKQRKLISLLVWDDRKLIGSCGIEKQGRRQGHIGVFGISLLKPYRSRGIGKKLAQKAIVLAKKRLGISQIDLECFANNKVGLKFYKGLGFIDYGRRPRAIKYKDQFVDKILFYKQLT